MRKLTSGTIGATSNRVDNQTISGMKRAIHVDAVPYQDRGQGYAKLFSNGREIISRLNDVDPLLPLLTPFLVELVETLLEPRWRVFRDG